MVGAQLFLDADDLSTHVDPPGDLLVTARQWRHPEPAYAMLAVEIPGTCEVTEAVDPFSGRGPDEEISLSQGKLLVFARHVAGGDPNPAPRIRLRFPRD